jgi:hypothetical protein
LVLPNPPQNLSHRFTLVSQPHQDRNQAILRIRTDEQRVAIQFADIDDPASK